MKRTRAVWYASPFPARLPSSMPKTLTFLALIRWPVLLVTVFLAVGLLNAGDLHAKPSTSGTRFFERRIRPILVDHCYECHSEEAGEQQGGLLLDRQSGWLEGGDTNKAVVPGEADGSLLIQAVRYDNAELQMPPEAPLAPEQVRLLAEWVQRGAEAPDDEMGESEFSRLGDQDHLFGLATAHWAFQKVSACQPPKSDDPEWDGNPVDRFVIDRMGNHGLTPSPMADPRTLVRRLHFDVIGLPPTIEDVRRFTAAVLRDRDSAVEEEIDRLLQSPSFGQHMGRMWLDVVRYADTDSAYRPDTKTPHYFPFAFTYRDYIVDSFNSDKPFDRFVREQIAADLMGEGGSAKELAALGFFAVGPHANRAQAEAADDWIDVTTRGLMGLTVACARCHDHKFEPIPTVDYYSLRGVFAALSRIDPLDEQRLPELTNHQANPADLADYQRRRAKIDKKMKAATGKKTGNNNRSVVTKIRETELAELLLFHPGAPARAMVVVEKKRRPASFVHIRGDATAPGEPAPRRFVKVLDQSQSPFTEENSGRLDLAFKITDPENPLTARVLVNRVWGHLMGSHLVATPSDFGLQGAPPTHPQLLDWLVTDFIDHDWSVKHLVRRIVSTRTFGQSAVVRREMATKDPENRLLWRANRRHLTIEAIRDSILSVSGQLDHRLGGRSEKLWDDDYMRRRAIYGYINRFNLDPTLRAFDFPSPMQTQSGRGESIVAPQALFTMNSPLVIDQSAAITDALAFRSCETDEQRIACLFATVLQRLPVEIEMARVRKFIDLQSSFNARVKPSSRFVESPWPLIAQSLLMSNEFQYVD